MISSQHIHIHPFTVTFGFKYSCPAIGCYFGPRDHKIITHTSSREEGSTEEEKVTYEKIFDFDTEETITPVSTDPSVTSPADVTSPPDETDTDGVRPGLSRQDSTLSPDELAEIRTKFYKSV